MIVVWPSSSCLLLALLMLALLRCRCHIINSLPLGHHHQSASHLYQGHLHYDHPRHHQIYLVTIVVVAVAVAVVENLVMLVAAFLIAAVTFIVAVGAGVSIGSWPIVMLPFTSNSGLYNSDREIIDKYVNCAACFNAVRYPRMPACLYMLLSHSAGASCSHMQTCT